jgi:hypothetical protein
MKSFIQYISEDIKYGKTSRATPSHTNEVRDTIYHYPHRDGKRHISVTYSSVGPKHKTHHNSEERITGVHDSKKHFDDWVKHGNSTGADAPAVLSRRGTTKPHHQLSHEKANLEIDHEHKSNTKANEVTSTTHRDYYKEHDREHVNQGGTKNEWDMKPGMGRKGNITKRKSERTPHPDWTYSNDSEHALSTNSETVKHTWTRNKK